MIGGTVAGKYRLTRILGRGGVGAVFQAEHLVTGGGFAVKVLDPEWARDEVVASRFAREARAASAVESEHIVAVVDAGTDRGWPFIVMELLRGEDLGARLRRARRLPVGETLHIGAQVLRGLVAAHAARIVHRDLKPDNVLLVEKGGDPSFVKIVDFGISKIEKPCGATAPMALTRKGIVVGTPLYMAPEQARGQPDVDGRADLFSLGAMMYECLAGRPPHVGETHEQVLLSMCTRDAEDVRAFAPDVPAEVAWVVGKALARERGERFGSAREMLGAIRRLAPGDPAVRPLRGEWVEGGGGGASPPIDAAPRVPVSPAGEPARASGRVASTPADEARKAAAQEAETREFERRLQRRRVRARVAMMAVVAMIAGAGAMLGVLAARRSAGSGAVPSTSPRPDAVELPRGPARR